MKIIGAHQNHDLESLGSKYQDKRDATISKMKNVPIRIESILNDYFSSKRDEDEES